MNNTLSEFKTYDYANKIDFRRGSGLGSFRFPKFIKYDN